MHLSTFQFQKAKFEEVHICIDIGLFSRFVLVNLHPFTVLAIFMKKTCLQFCAHYGYEFQGVQVQHQQDNKTIDKIFSVFVDLIDLPTEGSCYRVI